MSKPAFFIWLLAGSVLTSALVAAMLVIDWPKHALGWWIAGAAVLSHVVTWPISRALVRAMQ